MADMWKTFSRHAFLPRYSNFDYTIMIVAWVLMLKTVVLEQWWSVALFFVGLVTLLLLSMKMEIETRRALDE